MELTLVEVLVGVQGGDGLGNLDRFRVDWRLCCSNVT